MSEVIINRKASQRLAPLAFTCGCCGVTLRMRRDAATTSGPCPVCGTVIECCPVTDTQPSTRTVVTETDMPTPVTLRGSFRAKQKIQMPRDLDDSWKTRCEKDMKKFEKRKRIKRMFTNFFNSPLASVLQKAAIVLIVVSLLGTFAFIAYDRFRIGR